YFFVMSCSCAFPHSTLFLFSAPAPPAIYTLSLHDALPISWMSACTYSDAMGDFQRSSHHSTTSGRQPMNWPSALRLLGSSGTPPDRKSTRLNSSHVKISYAVFCLKKKKKSYTKSYTFKLES